MNGDAELLRRYAEVSSQDAFTEFVTRHVDLVYHAALRQLGGDAHRARDVTQLVFTDVARKAGSVCRHPAVVSWLHKSTRYAAAKVRRAEWNRQKYERQSVAMNVLQSESESPAEWGRLRPIIDDVLHELNERDREAVLLRFFEGRNFAEVGEALALSENGARMRVERALDKLSALLTRRGITSTAAALGAIVAQQASGTAPAGLAASIAGVAMSGATGGVTGAGPIAALLALVLASKGTVTLTLVGALALAGAAYQTTQARAAAVSLAAARSEYAALRTQLATLESRAQIAGQNQPAREGAVTNGVAANSRGSNLRSKSPAVPAADAEKATQRKALQQLLDHDPELRALRLDEARLRFKAGTGLFLRSIGFTPEQIEQAAETYVQKRRLEFARREGGIPPPQPASDLANFRSMFGDEAANRFSSWLKLWPATQLVNEFSAGLFFTDDPLTPEQAQRLADIITRAKLPTAPNNMPVDRLDEFVDWTRILAEAEPILSAAQLRGLHDRAALTRSPDPARSDFPTAQQ